jgi:alkylhydroperoxidase family enzyme
MPNAFSEPVLSAPRIAPLDAPYEPEIQGLFDKVMPPGQGPLVLFRTLAQNPRVLSRIMGGGLLDKGSLTLRQRELMILRTTANCACAYEWGVHVTIFADKAGLGPSEIAATIDRGSLIGEDGLIFALADALHDHAAIEDDLWVKLATVFSHQQIIELLVLAGFYHSISYVANGLRIATEPYAAQFADYA